MTAAAQDFENVTRNLYNLCDPELLASAMRLEAKRPAHLPPVLTASINNALIERLPVVEYDDALLRHQILSRLHTKLVRLVVRLLERRRRLYRSTDDDDGLCASYARRLRSFENQVFNLKNQTFTRVVAEEKTGSRRQ